MVVAVIQVAITYYLTGILYLHTSIICCRTMGLYWVLFKVPSGKNYECSCSPLVILKVPFDRKDRVKWTFPTLTVYMS